MPSTLRPRRTGENVRTSELCLGGAELSCELGARADAELGVDAGQVARDGALGEEERRGDLGVRPPHRDQVGDALLGRRSDPRRACGRRSRPSSPAGPLGPAARRRSPRSRRAPPRSPRAPAASAARAAASTPSASSARARPNGSPSASCCSTASSSRRRPPSTSPRAAATRPRQRVDVRQRPGAIEPPRSRLPRVQTDDRIVDEAELEQRLDLLGPPQLHRRLRTVGRVRHLLRRP